jgi:hypothetical protein
MIGLVVGIIGCCVLMLLLFCVYYQSRNSTAKMKTDKLGSITRFDDYNGVVPRDGDPVEWGNILGTVV